MNMQTSVTLLSGNCGEKKAASALVNFSTNAALRGQPDNSESIEQQIYSDLQQGPPAQRISTETFSHSPNPRNPEFLFGRATLGG
jgi:hypothetical protein